MTVFAGVDVGSMSAEAVLMKDDSIIAHSTIVVKPNPVVSARLVIESVLSQAGLDPADIAFCVSTGYGREKIPFAHRNVSEISCHGKGAYWANPAVRTIIDVGGQDSKIIRVDGQGHLTDFVMNDKCSAGTGRFLESIAKILGIRIGELGDLALKGEDPVPIASICTVFTQFDVMCFLADGRTVEDVCLGISQALAGRIKRLGSKVGLEGAVCITGGVAKNLAVVSAIEKALDRKVAEISVDPQIVGALGAALIAGESYSGQIADEGNV